MKRAEFFTSFIESVKKKQFPSGEWIVTARLFVEAKIKGMWQAQKCIIDLMYSSENLARFYKTVALQVLPK